jgi:hypothetical protein
MAQLVVHFMPDPIAGVAEMARVTRSGGVVAACVWDFAGDRSPISVLWHAARDIDADVRDESDLPGARAGHLSDLFEVVGLRDIVETELFASIELPTFEDWWEPFQLGVGPAGAYVGALAEGERAALRARCMEILVGEPFSVTAAAWAARGSP